MKARKIYLILTALLGFTGLYAQKNDLNSLKQDKYRPQYHFSTQKGWIGDPDGLVFSDGKFHLFWWGHATSKDLVHWEELPYPMKGAPQPFSYFSGSVVVDKNNTGGFGKNSMIAFYTRHFRGDTLPETQALSVSNNGGLEFHYYEHNPILDINKIFFRDPQVFWHEPSKLWKMVVSIPNVQQIQIYETNNLKDWTYCSTFSGLGAKNSFWECPDLFELPVLGSTGEKKWVILIGRGPNRVQYFVGDFDGKIFTADTQTADYLKNGIGLDGVVFDDFEKNIFSDWKVRGEAFADKSISTDAKDFLGNGYAGNLSKTKSTGSCKSKFFKITHNAINFLIAGGQNPDSLCIRLLVDGCVLRTATGDNTNVFKWNGWDVHDLLGKEACLEIIDMNNGDSNGSIAIDHIMFSNSLMNYQLEHALWLDYGNDYYATRTWRNYDTNRSFGDSVFAISWMGNWEYANKVPSSWGKGFQSVPRTMALKRYDAGYRVVQKSIPQLQQLRQSLHHAQGLKIEGTKKLDVFQPTKNVYEMEVQFKPLSNATFGFQLMVGEGRKLVLTLDPTTSTICLDRTNCTDFISDQQFTTTFAKKMYAPLSMANGIVRLHIFVDQSSIEVFSNDGEVVLSATTFPSEKQLEVLVFSNGGTTEITSLKAWELNSIWK